MNKYLTKFMEYYKKCHPNTKEYPPFIVGFPIEGVGENGKRKGQSTKPDPLDIYVMEAIDFNILCFANIRENLKMPMEDCAEDGSFRHEFKLQGEAFIKLGNDLLKVAEQGEKAEKERNKTVWEGAT